jgi:hypothetical protein
VNEVREYISGISGFKKVHIIERQENMGCDPSILDGVSCVISEHKKVIEVDDDIVTAPLFLEFMNKALNVFEHDERIWSISGYAPPIKIPASYTDDIYLSFRPSSWGLGTGKIAGNQLIGLKPVSKRYFIILKRKKCFVRVAKTC